MRVGAQIGTEHAERGLFTHAGFIGVVHHQLATLAKQSRLLRDQLAHQAAGLITVDDIAFKQGQPTLQTLLQCSLIRAIGHIVQARQRFAHLCQALGVGDEILIGLFSTGKPGVVIRHRHIGVPKQVFFGLVNSQVVGVQGVEQVLRSVHGVILVGAWKIGD